MDYKDLKGEVWKCIAGYEGLYQISNMGRVKSLEKEKNNKIIDIRSNNKEHLKTLESIRVLYNKDYLAEQEVV